MAGGMEGRGERLDEQSEIQYMKKVFVLYVRFSLLSDGEQISSHFCREDRAPSVADEGIKSRATRWIRLVEKSGETAGERAGDVRDRLLIIVGPHTGRGDARLRLL